MNNRKCFPNKDNSKKDQRTEYISKPRSTSENCPSRIINTSFSQIQSTYTSSSVTKLVVAVKRPASLICIREWCDYDFILEKTAWVMACRFSTYLKSLL